MRRAKEGSAGLEVFAGHKVSHGDEFKGPRAVRGLTNKERRGRMLVSIQPMSDAGRQDGSSTESRWHPRGKPLTAGRRCLKLPIGQHRHRLVNVPSVLRTAPHCDAGFSSSLLRLLARPMVSTDFREDGERSERGIGWGEFESATTFGPDQGLYGLSEMSFMRKRGS